MAGKVDLATLIRKKHTQHRFVIHEQTHYLADLQLRHDLMTLIEKTKI